MDLDTLKNTPPWEWPEDAGVMLLGILGDRGATQADRLVAAELAGDFTVLNDELADALLEIVCRNDEPDELRAEAAISLGGVLEYADTMDPDDPDDQLISQEEFSKIQRSLRQLFHDQDVPQEVRRRILEAAVRFPQQWHQQAVSDAFSSSHLHWRRTAAFCMRFVEGFDAQILEALDSDDPEVHFQAVCAAGNWELDGAWSRVAPLLTSEDTDKTLRLAAIDAAVGICPQEATDILYQLVESADEDIVEAALEALTMAEELAADEEFGEETEEEP